MSGLLECVINVSEGQRADVLAGLEVACGSAFLDRHTDADHHRSVFTLGGDPAVVLRAALDLAAAIDKALDISRHAGVHPRLGAIDVVPFIALDNDGDDSLAVEAARTFAASVSSELDLPVFLYDGADPAGRTLPSARREAFVSRPPDFGPTAPHPRLGAVCVGVRPFLVAVNCQWEGDDLGVASDVARAVRERDGGMPGVRALGFLLASQGKVQVSMNLVDLASTGIEAACTEVAAQARRRGAGEVTVELVGLLPAAELARCSPEFLDWTGLGPDHTIEARLQVAGA